MWRHAQSTRIDRHHATLDALPETRTRLPLASFTTTAEREHRFHTEPPDDSADVDGLNAARGIFTGVLVGFGMWCVIGLIVWLIAR
jgi:hypothetical protein